MTETAIKYIKLGKKLVMIIYAHLVPSLEYL